MWKRKIYTCTNFSSFLLFVLYKTKKNCDRCILVLFSHSKQIFSCFNCTTIHSSFERAIHLYVYMDFVARKGAKQDKIICRFNFQFIYFYSLKVYGCKSVFFCYIRFVCLRAMTTNMQYIHWISHTWEITFVSIEMELCQASSSSIREHTLDNQISGKWEFNCQKEHSSPELRETT